MKFLSLLFISILGAALLGCQKKSGKENMDTIPNNVTSSKIVLKPHPDAPMETEQFGQLVGKWECISKDKTTRDMTDTVWYENNATWEWGYVLGGHAVQNHWWQENTAPDAKVKDFFATGIFIFNPDSNLWETIVIGSRAHKIPGKFQAEYNDGKINMHDGTEKWLVTFYDMQKNSFNWKYEIPAENGDWVSISEINAVRVVDGILPN